MQLQIAIIPGGDVIKGDSLRIYQLDNNFKNKMEHVGTKAVLDLKGSVSRR